MFNEIPEMGLQIVRQRQEDHAASASRRHQTAELCAPGDYNQIRQEVGRMLMRAGERVSGQPPIPVLLCTGAVVK